MNVTPWEVSGKIDYDKLIREFGIKPITNLPQAFMGNILFRRKIVFAHRDFDRLPKITQKYIRDITRNGD